MKALSLRFEFPQASVWITFCCAPVVFAAVVVLALNTACFADRPNVLFIAVDDLNDWVNCMGGRAGVHTPNLDQLAERGVLFTNAHCAAPSCNPSRVALMTSVRPSTSGVYNNSADWRKSPRLAKAVTIPEHFRAAGYDVFGGGKIFHALSWIKKGYGKSQNDPRCWDRYFPSMQQPMPDAYWPPEAKVEIHSDGYVRWKAIAQGKDPQGRPAHYFDYAPVLKPDEVMADHKVIDWAAEQLTHDYDKPFFMAVGLFRPHIPWYAPQKYFDLYPLDEVQLPRILENDLDDCRQGSGMVRRKWQQWLVENDQWRSAVQAYLASISFADAQLGRLIQALDKSQYADNTVIVLWSDHGMHIGEKEHWEKFTLWEESTRVPLIVVAPKVNTPHAKCPQPVSLLDVYPTLIDLCDLPPRDDLDGRSLVPQLMDPATVRDEPALTTWGRGNHALRTQQHRYIRYANGAEELYDHNVDPDEFHNLAVSRPDEAQKIISPLQKWLPAVNAESVFQQK
jgi:arylsulfatase A-like enzyme